MPIRMNPLPDLDFIRSEVSYDSETGVFIRLPGNKRGCCESRFANKPTGTRTPDGYNYIQLGKKYYAAARVAWKLMTGVDPEEEIDHWDRNPSNDKWKNLRPAGRKLQIENRTLAKRPLPTGVYKYKNQSGYYVHLKNKYIGSYGTVEAATAARKEAERLDKCTAM